MLCKYVVYNFQPLTRIHITLSLSGTNYEQGRGAWLHSGVDWKTCIGWQAQLRILYCADFEIDVWDACDSFDNDSINRCSRTHSTCPCGTYIMKLAVCQDLRKPRFSHGTVVFFRWVNATSNLIKRGADRHDALGDQLKDSSDIRGILKYPPPTRGHALWAVRLADHN